MGAPEDGMDPHATTLYRNGRRGKATRPTTAGRPTTIKNAGRQTSEVLKEDIMSNTLTVSGFMFPNNNTSNSRVGG